MSWKTILLAGVAASAMVATIANAQEENPFTLTVQTTAGSQVFDIVVVERPSEPETVSSAASSVGDKVPLTYAFDLGGGNLTQRVSGQIGEDFFQANIDGDPDPKFGPIFFGFTDNGAPNSFLFIGAVPITPVTGLASYFTDASIDTLVGVPPGPTGTFTPTFLPSGAFADFDIGDLGPPTNGVTAFVLSSLITLPVTAGGPPPNPRDRDADQTQLVDCTLLFGAGGCTSLSLAFGGNGPGNADTITGIFNQVLTPVPVPAAVTLFGLGLIGVGALVRRRERK